MKIIRVQNYKVTLVFFLFIASLCCSQDIDKKKKPDIMAEYCVYSSVKEKEGWSLSVYKQNIPFQLSIRTISGVYSSYISVILDVPLNQKPQLGYGHINSLVKNPWELKPNTSLVTYTYNIYGNDFETTDSLHLLDLFGKTFLLHWEIGMDISSYKQKMVGDHTVYISGFCTEEQLKTIQERKKNRENAPSLP